MILYLFYIILLKIYKKIDFFNERYSQRLWYIKNMENILIAENIKIVPCDIDQFFSLSDITIKYGEITSLPDELFKLNIKNLNLHTNKIENLPRKIIKLKNLKSLNIFNNNLKILPVEIFSLTNLYNGLLDENIYPNTSGYGNFRKRLYILYEKGFIN